MFASALGLVSSSSVQVTRLCSTCKANGSFGGNEFGKIRHCRSQDDEVLLRLSTYQDHQKRFRLLRVSMGETVKCIEFMQCTI